jgi:hypothetical protein
VMLRKGFVSLRISNFVKLICVFGGLAAILAAQASVPAMAAAAGSTDESALTTLTTDVLVLGGGAGGTGAALGAARQGASVIIAEESGWLGGMITAAGVVAFDGNRGNFTTGIFAELKDRIRAAYGPGFRSLCTVSDLCFEPHVGAQVIDAWLAEYPLIQVYKHVRFEAVHKEGNRVVGATFRAEDGALIRVNAAVTIDGTEFGDIMAMAEAKFRLGRDTRFTTRELWAPVVKDNIVQDITYVVILKDYGPDADMTIAKPANFDPDEFACAVATYCPEGKRDWRPVREEADFWDYGRLPNGKFMLNWPTHGANVQPSIDLYDRAKRNQVFEEARQRTLRFVYFIQTVLGHKNLGIADDEYPTADGLPFFPYIRESRRVVGLTTLTSVDTVGPYARDNRALYRYGVAIINYTFDHHHTHQPYGFESNPRPPAFAVPLQSYIPQGLDGLMVVDKNIAVSHIVNGATRLQPIAFSGGAAAGVTAAMAAKRGVEPASISVRDVQDELLAWGSTLMPFRDVAPTHPFFAPIQRIGLAGVMLGDWGDDPLKLPALAPTELVSMKRAALFLARALGLAGGSPKGDADNDTDVEAILAGLGIAMHTPEQVITYGELIDWLTRLPSERLVRSITDQLTAANGRKYTGTMQLTRADLAFLLDYYLDPFHSLPLPQIVE